MIKYKFDRGRREANVEILNGPKDEIEDSIDSLLGTFLDACKEEWCCDILVTDKKGTILAHYEGTEEDWHKFSIDVLWEKFPALKERYPSQIVIEGGSWLERAASGETIHFYNEL